jgi:hypothetical protein
MELLTIFSMISRIRGGRRSLALSLPAAGARAVLRAKIGNGAKPDHEED